MLIKNTDFIDLPIFVKGKVRDVYDLGDSLLIIVTDRISAFDVVFDDLIPNKGKALNMIADFWFDYTKDIIKNHVITNDVDKYPKALLKYKDELQGRSVLVKKVKMVEAECIVRGYLEGSGLKDYNKTGEVCGIKLPKGLKQAQKLPEPIFTPSTKAIQGHDMNVSFRSFEHKIGMNLAKEIRDVSLKLFEKASEYAESKGLVLADTKFEFGIFDGELVLADEIFTPDSSRFWDKNDYEVGRAQKSFDKQFLRDYLETSNWDKKPPAPKLPDDVVKNTEAKYIEAYEILSGKKFI
ncbi:MAG: phosphoribosylaminoimidazolesuccinocarboxamide synthase [Clostridiales bacterium]